MTYPEAIDFLYGLRWFGAKFGLANTRRLAALAGNPQDQLRFIHVAGTNGKGSTCAILESIYRTKGLRVGLFTSPHLVAFGERVQVDRQPLSNEEVVQLVSELRPWLAQFEPDQHPTFFEVVTVMALRHFAARGCDLVLWETGLGGRLDATNIVTPLASVITNIQYDHQKYLGETLASIAGEKAGIIKPGILVITGTDAPEALQVIRETARQQSSPLTIVPPEESRSDLLEHTPFPLRGEHQKRNAAVALAVVRGLQAQLPVGLEEIRSGLSRVDWPGRLQLVELPGGRKVLLDGAHNVAGAETLAAALSQDFPGARPALVLGILRDKDWSRMCEILAPLASRILLVPVHSERTAEPHGLAEVCHRVNPGVRVSEHASLTEALAATSQETFVVVAGSLYLIGEALEALHLSAATEHQERTLNEWSVAPPTSRPA
jgi:dihydrofolate synthase / folylpolyglutamate synthase